VPKASDGDAGDQAVERVGKLVRLQTNARSIHLAAVQKAAHSGGACGLSILVGGQGLCTASAKAAPEPMS
jgi:hypothetical protein